MTTRFGTATIEKADGKASGSKVAALAMQRAGVENPSLALVFAPAGHDHEAILQGVRAEVNDAKIIGMTTASQFGEANVSSDGLGIAVIESDGYAFSSGFATGVGEDEFAAFDLAAGQLSSEKSEEYDQLGVLVLLDGLVGKGEEVCLLPATRFGEGTSVVGGTAADNYAFKATHVFNDEKAFTDALSLTTVRSRLPLAVGVAHGHQPVSDGVKVTKVEGNRVYELDGKPAVDVWMDLSRDAAKEMDIDVDAMWDDADQLGRYTCIFEAGLDTGQHYKVRWPGIRPDTRDHLPFACTIAPGSVLRVMRGTPDSQVDSATRAARQALNGRSPKEFAGALVFDCAVRGAILGERFGEAVKAISSELDNIPILGGATYGEIGLTGGALSGFHNTTSVVVLFPHC